MPFAGIRLAVLAALALPAPAAFAANAVGVRAMPVAAPERDAPLDVTLWYPAGAGGALESVGESPVFNGVPAWRDADIADGSFQIVLLAHGGLRAAPNQSGWIAADLASRGMLVAVVPPSRPAGAEAAVAETWLRPADLSATLTALETDPDTAAHAAPVEAAAVGFFLGGTAALSLAGARIDAERYAKSCDTPVPGPDCAWFAAEGVDLQAIDAAKLTRSARDPRIGVVVAVDPELTASLAPESLAGLAAKITVINLGDASSVAPYLDASGLQAEGASYATLAGATAFTAMATCGPRGAEILAAEGEDDALCGEDAAARDSSHARLADMIAGAVVDR